MQSYAPVSASISTDRLPITRAGYSGTNQPLIIEFVAALVSTQAGLIAAATKSPYMVL